MAQPIIRGIQAVGAVDIKYQYNGENNKLTLPSSIMRLGGNASDTEIDTSGFVSISGFRLDGEFLRAVQQIASSVQIPILGGGAVALTNNNRSGSLSINATRVSTPDTADGSMLKDKGMGPIGDAKVYDLTFIAQAQQAQVGGDDVGATIQVIFKFCGLYTVIQFEGCTIANVDPVGLSGNDAVNYNVQINYLNWTVNYSANSESDVVNT